MQTSPANDGIRPSKPMLIMYAEQLSAIARTGENRAIQLFKLLKERHQLRGGFSPGYKATRGVPLLWYRAQKVRKS
jgi:hypothetical protein